MLSEAGASTAETLRKHPKAATGTKASREESKVARGSAVTGWEIVTRTWALPFVVALAAAIGCGGGGSAPVSPTSPSPPSAGTPPTPSPSPSPSPSPTLSATVTITATNRFQPAEVRVLVGGRVTFVNENNRAYDIVSDPRLIHTDCPALMEVGFIVPGQTKVSGPLTVARTCGYHDHMQETNPELQGRIIVQGES
jgi:plastocyanin